MKADETTHLTAVPECQEPSESTANSAKKFVTVGDAIERIGCGFGTILYVSGAYGCLILSGANVSVMSIVSLLVRCEWNLATESVCALQVMDMVFAAISSLSLSNMGDKFGKKPVLIVATLGSIIAGVLSSFTTQLWQLLCCRAIAGTCVGLGIGPGIAYSAEIPTIKFSALGLTVGGLGWGIGTILSGGMAYLTIGPLDWRGYLLSTTAICSVFLLVVLVIRESPRHDFEVEKVDEAQKTLEILAKLNCSGQELQDLVITKNLHMPAEEILNLYQRYRALKGTGHFIEFCVLVCVNLTGEFVYMSILYVGSYFINEGYCRPNFIARTSLAPLVTALCFILASWDWQTPSA